MRATKIRVLAVALFLASGIAIWVTQGGNSAAANELLAPLALLGILTATGLFVALSMKQKPNVTDRAAVAVGVFGGIIVVWISSPTVSILDSRVALYLIAAALAIYCASMVGRTVHKPQSQG